MTASCLDSTRAPRIVLVVAAALCGALLPAPGSAALSAILVPGAVETITEALSLAQPGDTVLVGPGAYSSGTGEQFPLSLPGGVTLLSSDGPWETVIFAGAADLGPLVAARGPGAIPPGTADSASRLEGFTVDGAGLAAEGVLIDQADAVVSRSLLTGFDSPGGTACRLRGPASPSVITSTIGGNRIGLDLVAAVSPHVEFNILLEDSLGVYCTPNVADGVIACNLFFANLFDVRGRSGFCLTSFYNGTNLTFDPRVCDREEGDFRLAADSPIAPAFAKSGCGGALGAFGVGCERPAPILDSVSPALAHRPQSIDLDVAGAYLDGELFARLSASDGTDFPGELIASTDSSASFRFDLSAAAKGDLTVVVGDDFGREDSLFAAFRVTLGDDIAVPQQHPTIAEAIAAAFEADTVRVAPGVYGDATGEPMPIRLRRRVAVVGAGADQTIIRSVGALAFPEVGKPTVVAALGPFDGGDVDELTVLKGLGIDGGGEAAWGVLVLGASPQISECVIEGMRGDASAAAARVLGGQPALSRNTIVRNRLGVQSLFGARPQLQANVIALNEVGVDCGAGGQASFSCNDIWQNEAAPTSGCPDPTGTAGNVSLDPLFCDRLGRDLQLAEDSPCAPANSGGCGQIGAFAVACANADFRRRIDVPAEAATWGEALGLMSYGDTLNVAIGEYGDAESLPLRLRPGRVIRGTAGPGQAVLATPSGGGIAPVMMLLQGDSTSALIDLGFDARSAADLIVRADSGRGERIEGCAFLRADVNPLASAGLSLRGGRLDLVRSLFYANANGVLAINDARLFAERNVIARSGRYGLFCDEDVVTSAVCNDVWGSGAADYAGACGALLGVANNVSIDPLFCDEAAFDLRLRPDSPILTLCSESLVEGALDEVCDETGVGDGARPGAGGLVPAGFELMGPTPNAIAASDGLVFTLALPRPAFVRARLIAPSGRLARTVVERGLPAGYHRIEEGDPRRELSAGVYILIVEAGAERASRRVILLR